MAAANRSGRKLLMIGVDAADVQFIRLWLDKLPRFRELFTKGTPAILNSPASETLTSSVWPTFSTGSPPAEHGIYYPMQWDPAAMSLRRVSAGWLPARPFWHELEQEGLLVTTIDVPFSLAPGLEHGLEILNWGSQESLGPPSCNRRGLLREVLERFGRHPMGEDIPIENPPARLEQLRQNLVAGAYRRSQLIRWAMSERPWDLFIAVFAESHRAGHILWREGAPREPDNPLLDVYRAIDDSLSYILDASDRQTTTVVVFSLHGMRANSTQEHFLPLMMERINSAFLGKPAQTSGPSGEAFNPVRTLRAAVPPRVQSALASSLPSSVRDWVVRRTFCGSLDWRQTPAFVLPGSGEGYIRFNLAGREAQGLLDPASEAFARYKTFLRRSLMSFRDAATYSPVTKDVVFASEDYRGARSGFLPDAVVLWNSVPPAAGIRSNEFGSLAGRLTTGRKGEHQPQGFAAFLDGTDPCEQPPLREISGFAPWVRRYFAQSAAG